MRKTLLLPSYASDGITHKDSVFPSNVVVIGGDTETYKGEPLTLQLSAAPGETDLIWVDKRTILEEFLSYMDKHISRHERGLVYFHNLDFDLVALLYGGDLTKFRDTEFKKKVGGWDIDIFCGKRYFAKARKAGHKSFYIIDSSAFLPFSLKKIAKELRLAVEKLPPPKGLGDVRFKPGDKEFEAYARRDAEVQYYVARWIVDVHREYGVQPSVSLPQLAGRIFQKKFLSDGQVIPPPPKDIIKAALLSYHGGKNGMYVEPGRYEGVSEVDLNSAYPYAMQELPPMTVGEYSKVSRYTPEYAGIYCISGSSTCPYNAVFDDEFRPIRGKFSEVWITSYELAEALAQNEIKITSIWGYVWVPGPGSENPFGDYVRYFYKMKQETPKENSLYTFYKLGLNTLYGKLVQMVEMLNEETREADFETWFDSKGKIKVKRVNKTYRAGAFFNPFIASLITGKVRAMIHNLEHRFKALHTATDSVKTLLPISGESAELGGYKLELKGRCILFRNKLYLHYNEAGDLKKFALHGFSGSPEQLLELYRKKTSKYTIDHLFKVREALIQKQVPLAMVKGVARQLRIDWSKFKD